MTFKSKRSRMTDISPKVKEAVWERDNHRCILCGSPYGMPNAHYISRAQSGLGIEQNVVTLCFRCHERYDHSGERQKYREAIREYLQSRYEDWDESQLIFRKV